MKKIEIGGFKKKLRGCGFYALYCAKRVLVFQAERGHGVQQLLALGLQAGRGGGAFFDQGGVLLRHLVHLRDGLAHLGHAGALLAAGDADFAHDVALPGGWR